jgi:hypothetical protein
VPGLGSRTSIPLPQHTLLVPQAEPDCEFRAQSHPRQDEPGAERAKVDYERDCYRQAELIVRTRLRLLQASFAETLKALVDHRPAAPNSKTEPSQVQ